MNAMKVLFKILFVIVIYLYLHGCATTPPPPRFSEISPSLSKAAPDTGRIFIYRKQIIGEHGLPSVKLNGEEVGFAIVDTVFYVDRKPGNYKIEISTEVDRHLSLVLEKGQTRYVRLNTSIGFVFPHVYPELVENKVGEEEIQSLIYTRWSKKIEQDN